MCASFFFFMELTLRCYFVPRETARTWSLLDSRRKALQGSQRENYQAGICEKKVIWLNSRMYYKLCAYLVSIGSFIELIGAMLIYNY